LLCQEKKIIVTVFLTVILTVTGYLAVICRK